MCNQIDQGQLSLGGQCEWQKLTWIKRHGGETHCILDLTKRKCESHFNFGSKTTAQILANKNFSNQNKLIKYSRKSSSPVNKEINKT